MLRCSYQLVCIFQTAMINAMYLELSSSPCHIRLPIKVLHNSTGISYITNCTNELLLKLQCMKPYVTICIYVAQQIF